MASTDEIDRAIIYSAKHLGYWDDRLEALFVSGKMNAIYVDLPSLRTALSELLENENNMAKYETLDLEVRREGNVNKDRLRARRDYYMDKILKNAGKKI